MENEGMGARLPKQWWDIVLDGSTYRVDLGATPYPSLGLLRAAIYREADVRTTNVATHKAAVSTLVVQAWGTGNRAPEAPELKNAAAQPAPVCESEPVLTVVQIPGSSYKCDCDAGSGAAHQLTCSFWGDKRMLYPVRPTSTPQEQPPTMTVEPEAEELSAADMEALLGPCTCGQSPTCTPSCARAGA